MSANYQRTVRMRAKRQGLLMMIRGDVVTLYNTDAIEVRTGTLSAVDEWLRVRDVHRQTGPAAMPLPDEWIPWVDLFVAEQNAAKRRPGTIITRSKHLATFARAVDKGPLSVTRDDLVAYLGQNDWKPRTSHSVMTTLRLFFRFLCNFGHRADNPAAMLPNVRIPRSLPRPCPDHVILDAYTAIKDARLRLALRVAVETGMRRVEIAGMRPRDVEGRPGDFTLHVEGKGGNERVIPITDALAGELLRVDTEWVFPSKRGDGPISARWLGKQLARALPDHWTIHTVRHRFASLAYQRNNDLRAVQELLGHQSPITTSIYTAVSDQSMRTSAAAAFLEPLCGMSGP